MDLIKAMHTRACAWAATNPAAALALLAAGGWQFVFDHASFHNSALPRLAHDYPWFKHVPIPVCSPDFNKVVEHAISQLKRGFAAEMTRRYPPAPDTPLPPIQDCKDVLMQVAARCITADWVEKDAATLQDTWRVVATPENEVVTTIDGKHTYFGTAGNWAWPELR